MIPDGFRDSLADPGERPRVLATGADFERADRLRGNDEHVTAWFDRLIDRGEALLDEPPSEYDRPNGLRLLSVSRTVLDRVRTLGALYQFTGEDRYAERAWRELEAAADFPDWNPSHFLDVAEMTAAFGVGYDWLHAYLDEERRERLRVAIVGKGFREAMPGYRAVQDRGAEPTEGEGTIWWITVDHNWNTVCNGGLSIGALALAGDDGVDHERLAELLERARESLDRPLGELAPNGGWAEGVTYWRYNARYLAYYLASLEATLGTDLGIADVAGIDDIGEFPLHLTGSDGTFDFGDSHTEHRVPTPALHWFGRRFDAPAWSGYQRDAVGHEGDVLDLLWYDPDRAADPWHRGLPDHARFPGAEDALTARSGWGEDDAFLGLKAGDNQVNHGDLDLGTFVFDARGVRWATDLGSSDYDLPGYWEMGRDGGRWRYYRKRAEGHNLIVVDPGDGPDQDPFATARLSRVETDPEEAFAILDLSGAYSASVRRGVALRDGRETLLVQDEIESEDPVEAWWFVHTAAEIETEGARATLRRAGEAITARIRSPEGAAFEARDAEPLPSSPDPGDEAPVEGVRKLAINVSDVTSETIAVELGDGSGAPVAPLAEW
jgi:hypothetical protein